MKKYIFAFLIATLLGSHVIYAEPIIDQNQVIIPPYNGVVYSTTTTGVSKLFATTSPTVGWLTATSTTISSYFPLANILKLSNLTSNGFVKTSGGDGTLSIDTTTYESGLTAGDGLTRTVNDFDCDIASGSVFGCLSTTDWTTFNSKLGSYDAWTHPASNTSATTSAIRLYGNASSTISSAHWLKVGTTASTTIDSTGNVILSAAGTLTIPALTSALIQTDGNGLFAEYGGTSCTNQFPRSLSALVIAACASVALASDVSGDLPFANLTQGSALSVLGVTGNATADNASIAAGTDNQVLRRSGTSLAFGQVNLASTNAVTNVLTIGNGGTNNNVIGASSTVAFSNGAAYVFMATSSLGVNLGDTTGTLAFGRGGTGLTTATDDTTLISSGSAWVASAIPNCTDTGGNHLNYTTATNAISCGTSSGGGGGVGWATTTSSNESIYFYGLGNVGVGTTTPQAKLAVSSTTQASKLLPLFTVASTTGDKLFNVTGEGRVVIGTDNDDYDNTTNSIFLIETNGRNNIIPIISHGTLSNSVPGINTVSTQGTKASPSATLSGNQIALFIFDGYGTNDYRTGAAMDVLATQSWTNNNNGSAIRFRLKPNNSSSLTEIMRLSSTSMYIGKTSANFPGFPLLEVNGTSTATHFIASSSAPIFAGYQANGNGVTNTATLSGNNISSLQAYGFGATARATAPRASIDLGSSEDWTDSEQGTYMSFRITPEDTTSTYEAMSLSTNGISLNDGQYFGEGINITQDDEPLNKFYLEPTANTFRYHFEGKDYGAIFNFPTTKDVFWGETSDTGTYTFRGKDLDITEGDLYVGDDAVFNTQVYFSNLSTPGGSNNAACLTTAAPQELINEGTGDCTVSSRRFKHDIKKLNLDSEKIIQSLKPSSFIYNDKEKAKEGVQYGFIAEEAAEALPELANFVDGKPYNLDKSAFDAVLWDFAQKQIEKNKSLEERIKVLEDELNKK